MDEVEGCENRKSDVTSLERKLKLHILVYIKDIIDISTPSNSSKTHLSKRK